MTMAKLKVDTKRSLAVKCTTLQGLRYILPTCFYQVHKIPIPVKTKILLLKLYVY